MQRIVVANTKRGPIVLTAPNGTVLDGYITYSTTGKHGPGAFYAVQVEVPPVKKGDK